MAEDGKLGWEWWLCWREERDGEGGMVEVVGVWVCWAVRKGGGVREGWCSFLLCWVEE